MIPLLILALAGIGVPVLLCRAGALIDRQAELDETAAAEHSEGQQIAEDFGPINPARDVAQIRADLYQLERR